MRGRDSLCLVALLAVIVGCGASGTARSWRVSAPVVRSAVSNGRPAARKRDMGPEHPGSATGLVERSLHQRGIRFGTDGSARALYAFLQSRYPAVRGAQARTGDILFFDLGDGCAEHTAVVESVDPSGRVAFREWRDGSVLHSFADANRPRERRDEGGRILNSFLRIKRPDDQPGTRYFAGEMLCAVIRPNR